MKAIRIHAYNDQPRLEGVSVPDLPPDQVLVRIQAAALNPLDALVVAGYAAQFFDIGLPLTLGTDFAGIVEQVGPEVTQWQPGDRVLVWTDAGSSGGLAEYAAVPAWACARLPSSLSFAEGAAIPTAAITAWHALFSSAGLKPGETVLVHAAAGGVGSFAVQFARNAGARVIATASGDGVALARSLGAAEVIDYQQQDFAAVSPEVDVVLDLVGGQTQVRSFSVLRSAGRLVSTSLPPDQSLAQSLGVTATMFYASPYYGQLQALVDLIEQQDVKVMIDRTLPLTAFDDAWGRLTSGRARGKIVLAIE